MKKKLTTWEAACIITGYGIGAGVLSMPYLAEKNGFLVATLILVIAYIASYVLHMMIADLALKNGEGAQVISCLSRFLFRGRYKRFLEILFFVLMGLILVTNLAAYIAGAEEVIVSLIPVSKIAAELIFYVVAAAVVLFGLKAVGVSEKYAVGAIFALIAVLAVGSVMAKHNTIKMFGGNFNQMLAYFGLAMFSMSAFFSVPQAVEGLEGNRKEIRKAVFLGLLNTFVMIEVISFCALWASKEVTEVSMVGWSAGIGVWAQIIGSVFTVLAMLTTYWSLSLALGGIINDMLKVGDRISWLIATLPSLILALCGFSGFMDLMRTAGGLIAIVVAVMVVPAYSNARREVEGSLLNHGGRVTEILVVIAYILMAVGSVVPY